MKNFKHQDDALAKSEGMKGFAYFMEPGTGKTRVALLDAARLHQKGLLDAVIVLCPNSVKTSWVAWPHLLEPGDKDQVTAHLGDSNVLKGVWFSNRTGKNGAAWRKFENEIDDNKGRLIVIVVNYEAIRGEHMRTFLSAMMKGYRTMIIADESTRIGRPGAQQTKYALKLASQALYRRILSGTPAAKSPMKLFSQFKFLGDNVWPFDSFYAFRSRFGILGGFEGREVVAYRNLEQLSTLIEPYSFRATKAECLDLPPQIYVQRHVEMSAPQIKAYDEMRKQFYTTVENVEVTANIVITQMLRLHQITGGYLQQDGQVFELITPSLNPKFVAALDIIQSHDKQTIVWCNFRSEVEGMKSVLDKAGITYAEFHGGVPESERLTIRKGFQRGICRVLIGTQSAGGIGIDEFKVAPVVVFVSNDADTEKRIQAEDRNHRIGSEMHEKVTYYDIVCSNTVDTKVLKIFREDAKVSAQVMKDNWREWI